MGIDRAKFRKPVLPGDQMHYHVKKIRSRGRVWRFFGEAKVDGQIGGRGGDQRHAGRYGRGRAFAAGATTKNG